MADGKRLCFLGYAEWVEQHYGIEHWWEVPDDEVFHRILGDGDMIQPFEGFTCLLPDGHDGEHEWTSDGEIVVTFPRDRHGLRLVRGSQAGERAGGRP